MWSTYVSVSGRGSQSGAPQVASLLLTVLSVVHCPLIETVPGRSGSPEACPALELQQGASQPGRGGGRWTGSQSAREGRREVGGEAGRESLLL